MNRERIAWSVSLLLIAILAFSLPGSLAQRDDDYSFVRTLIDIHRHVVDGYVEPVDEQQLRESAIEGMLSQLDPYTVYVPPAQQEAFDQALEGVFKGVGIRLDQLEDGTIQVVTPIDGSPALEAGVMAGDVILKVDGETIQGLRLPEIVKKISGPVGTEVTLTVRHHDGQTQDLTMRRQEIQVPNIIGYTRNAENGWNFWIQTHPRIAYVRISQFTSDTADRVRQALQPLVDQEMQGLILDLRFNPGGRLEEAVELVDLFLEEGVIVSTRGRNRPEQQAKAKRAGTLPPFPMIVLVNEHSASAAEIVAGSLMDNGRALVMGARTYGKGSVQEVVPLDAKGGELKITTAYYYLPSGRLVHRRKEATDWGVSPAIVVPLDESAQRELIRERFEREIMRAPTTATTAPSTAPSTAPTTDRSQTPEESADAQLEQALNTMIGSIVMHQASPRRGEGRPPQTQPAAASTIEIDDPSTEPILDEELNEMEEFHDVPATLPTEPALPVPSTQGE